MYQLDKNYSMFVVLYNSFYYHGAISTNKAETKILGRRTGASPAVILSLRDELCSSDLPSFIYQKSFFMLHKNDGPAISADKRAAISSRVISDVLLTDFPANMRENLRAMMDAFFLFHQGIDEAYKLRVYATYEALYNALGEMEQLDKH